MSPAAPPLRLARTAAGATAVVVDRDGRSGLVPLADLAERVPGELPDFAAVDEDWTVLTRKTGVRIAELAEEADAWREIGEGDLGPALPSRRSRVFALGGNYIKHMVAMMSRSPSPTTPEDLRAERGCLPPWGFHVLPDLMIGHGGAVVPPSETQYLDYEGEYAVMVTTGGRDLDRDSVRFGGLTAFSDFSIRDGGMGGSFRPDRGPLTWALSKNFETGTALGPWMMFVDDLPDPVDVRCLVNGEVRQDSAEDELIYQPEDAVSYLSRFFTVRPGDIVASGCPTGAAAEEGPGSARFLRPGDTVSVVVGGVGELRNTVGTWGAASGMPDGTEERA